MEVTTPEINDRKHNRKIKAREIVKATGISQRIVLSILHEKLGVKFFLAKWVLGLLSVEDKHNHEADSEADGFCVAILMSFCINTLLSAKYVERSNPE